MRLGDFDYDLPAELVAQRPLPERAASRLLVLAGASAEPVERRFHELPRILEPGDLLVLNDTRVVPARLHARKEGTGGRVELLVERLLGPRRVLARTGSSKPVRPGARLELAGGVHAVCRGRRGELAELVFSAPVGAVLASWGEMPLPPYIAREADAGDRERYQTVYARAAGAVAAPTAGLHFDAPLLAVLRDAGVEVAHLTLHVGSGTFQPVRVHDPREHRLHAEVMEVSPELAARVAAARRAGRRVVAVGTTTVRALETAAARGPGGAIVPYAGETDLYILPGFRFRCVDVLITNFHLPRSTLLMMVSAFGGRERVLAAYRAAVAARFRFFSYGDAMLVTRAPAGR